MRAASLPDNTISDLYQRLILEHNRSPRCHGVLDDASHQAVGRNPICGDEVTIYLKVLSSEDRIANMTFTAQSCAICRASASMMCEHLSAAAVMDIQHEVKAFKNMLGSSGEVLAGDLSHLAAVRAFPARAKCALLPWQTLLAAIENRKVFVTGASTNGEED